jgi:hypothetical protein
MILYTIPLESQKLRLHNKDEKQSQNPNHHHTKFPKTKQSRSRPRNLKIYVPLKAWRMLSERF